MAVKDRGVIYSAVSPFRVDVEYDAGGPSMTRQEFAEECDVNQIMRRFEETGVLPGPVGAAPVYLDLANVPSNLQEALNVMIEGEEAFMRLPALVRKEFDNDALQFMDFAVKPENLAKMREWGLAPGEQAPPVPVRVEVVSPPAPAPGAPPAGSASPAGGKD